MIPSLDFVSPVSGARLKADGAHCLRAAGERWPVIDGIAYLRTGREEMVGQSLCALDADDVETATAVLLQDRDDWAPGTPPTIDECREVVRDRLSITFREAMARLRFGPVADYLAHRWSDPTFLSGLALAEAYWRPNARVLALGCGTGAFLRAFAPHAASVLGADVVFSKLWLARHFVAPKASLVCFDASTPWPVAEASADLVFCHDVFYFLTDKTLVAKRMRAVAGGGGAVLVGHVHNAAVENHSAGSALTADEYAAMFSGSIMFDDAELTRALLQRRAPRAASARDLAGEPAIALASPADEPATVTGLLDRPPPGATLRRNPLYVGDQPARVRFPSDLYADEYGALVTYPETGEAPLRAMAAYADDVLIRNRVLVDLPERW